MIAYSQERMYDDTPCLAAVCTGEFDTELALFIDVLIYRETLPAGTYTLVCGEKTWSFELPEAFTMQGFPDAVYNVQVDLKE